MSDNEFPMTVVEILRILYFSEGPKTSIELAKSLKNRDIDVDPRTVRYHLSHLEEKGFIKRLGRKGAKLTERGVNEIRRLLVYERIGIPSIEIEKLITDSDYDINKNKGKIMVNAIMVPKDKYDLVVPLLLDISKTNVITSPLLAILDEKESIWHFEVKEGHVGILGISSRTYDIIFQKSGICLQSTATGLYHLENNTPKGFVEIISHLGTTISPGELLIRGGYTSVHKVASTGSGYVTAAIKTFSSFCYEDTLRILEKLKKNNISGVAEHSSIIPENKRISVMDKNKGYLVVYGGANYFAPIVETGISKKLEIARDLYDIQKMKEPEKVLK